MDEISPKRNPDPILILILIQTILILSLFQF